MTEDSCRSTRSPHRVSTRFVSGRDYKRLTFLRCPSVGTVDNGWDEGWNPFYVWTSVSCASTVYLFSPPFRFQECPRLRDPDTSDSRPTWDGTNVNRFCAFIWKVTLGKERKWGWRWVSIKLNLKRVSFDFRNWLYTLLKRFWFVYLALIKRYHCIIKHIFKLDIKHFVQEYIIGKNNRCTMFNTILY